MTVNELIEQLQDLRDCGWGEKDVTVRVPVLFLTEVIDFDIYDVTGVKPYNGNICATIKYKDDDNEDLYYED